MRGAPSWPRAVTEDTELRTLCENAGQSINVRLLSASNSYLSMQRGNPFSVYVHFYCAADDVAIDVLRMQLMLPIDSTILQINSTLIMSGLY